MAAGAAANMSATDHPTQQTEEAQWEEQTRPSREAPLVNSLYLRKDYAAACPGQHLAYLKCMRDSKSWLPFQAGSACQEEWKAFAVCRSRAKAANITPEAAAEAAARPSTAALVWQDLQREPVVIAAKMAWHDTLCKLGLGELFFGSSSSSSSSSEAGSSSETGSSSEPSKS